MNKAITFEEIKKQIKQKSDINKIAESVIKQPELISDLIENLKTEKSALKFSYEKILRLISEKHPQLVYPYFTDISKLLDSDNNFIKWGSIITIANLTAADTDKKFDKVFKKYYKPVTGPVMITAANIIANSWKIALAKTYLANKIAKEILKVEKGEYINRGEVSPECKNIICGHAIESFACFNSLIKSKKAVLDFAGRNINNSRKSTAKKAEKFLNKYK